MSKSVAETITVTGEGLTVDLILWRKFRKPTPGLVERVYDLNPGLAKLGAYLPVGTTFTIPETDADALAAKSNIITLWE